MKERKRLDAVHPGRVIRELCLEKNSLSVSDAAQVLGVSRKNFSLLLNGHFAVSPDMAIRLSLAFGTSAEMWLMLQMAWDLEEARKKLSTLEIRPVSGVEAG